jgi:uncharacterized protein YyaL (SSP411 family)
MQDNHENKRKSNRLIHEKSPYLLQHAYNPVDWYPWTDEAFAKAKAEDKPLFVSIGYSTCHWCHVMEKECFDDEEVAKLMNDAFVSIKVDREERPDLDGAYMAMCQMMGRSCGWPLNVIMAPDKNVFFITSYIPKNSRFGLTGMVGLIPQIREMWKTRRADLEIFAKDIKTRMERLENRTQEKELGKEVLDDAYEKLFLRFDAENGGFGSAPKFPAPHNLLFLLSYWNRTKEKQALVMVEKTLRSMRLGGIFDQVGFGFHRYSTDKVWLVPHFEKMLYDQALLALAYTEAYQATGAGKFKVTAKEVLGYVLKTLTSPEGGFYSAEDADSEGEEGKFYIWTEEEIRKTLTTEDASVAVALFGIEANGNFYEPSQGRNGGNILHLAKPLDQLASEIQVTMPELIHKLGKIQKTLFEAREKRIHPAKDDKILADWNGLMIAALAKASTVFDEPNYLRAAVKASNFVLENMKEADGTLCHRFAKGEKAISGFLDDYALLIWGLLEVYEANFEEEFLEAAVKLTELMKAKFWDEKDAGFFFTDKDSVDASPRRKEVYDGAMPSGNSVALLNLLRLGRLIGNTTYEEMANSMTKTFAAEVQESPMSHTFFLRGINFILGPTYNVTLVGDLHEERMLNVLKALRGQYLPNMVVSLKPQGKVGIGYEKIDGKATAYVCRDQICLPPTNKAEKMLEHLGGPKDFEKEY